MQDAIPGQVGEAAQVGDCLTLEQVHPLVARVFAQLHNEAGLADARFTRDVEHSTPAGEHLIYEGLRLAEFFFSSKEIAGRGSPPGLSCDRALYLVAIDRFLLAFDLHRFAPAQPEAVPYLVGRRLADQYPALRGDAHQSGGQVDLVAHHRILLPQG